jgi:hypothetical protein
MLRGRNRLPPLLAAAAAAAATGEDVLASNAALHDVADARGVVVQLLPATEAARSSAEAPPAAAAADVDSCWSVKGELPSSCWSLLGAHAKAAAARLNDRFET